MPNEPIPHEHIADLMEHCARVVAQTRDTVCKTRQIIRQCKEERKRYDDRHGKPRSAADSSHADRGQLPTS